MESESVNLTNLFFTFFLVFLNGFFVAAEFAIVKVRSSQLDTGSKKSVNLIAKSILENLEGYLAATQLGITLASLALGWVGEETFTLIMLKTIALFNLDITPEFAHKLALPLAFALITFFHIVFGELVPKSIGIRYPQKTALFIAPFLKVFRTAFLPIIAIFNHTANFLLRMMGLTPSEEGEIHSEEELKLIIAESAEGGAIDDNERELIHNVFDFDNRIVREIYRHNLKVTGIDIESSIEDITALVIEEGYSRYPVYKDSKENIVGMIHAKDMYKNLIQNKDFKFEAIVREVHFIPENKRVIDLLKVFQEKKTQFGVVVDELGSTMGIVTLEDILEELVGDIQDEHDMEQEIVEKINEFTFRVYAQNSVEDINEKLPFDIPLGDDYETLSGYITTTNKDIVNIGEVLVMDTYEIKIIQMYRTSPEIIEITIINPKVALEG
jgi:CBS domain containing-hemolysin-like protein